MPEPGGDSAEAEARRAAGTPSPHGGWDQEAVRRLRRYLGDSQAELAQRLGTRQQTVSEWETGRRQPRRMSRRLLQLVAEEAGFYDASGTDETGPDAARPSEPRPGGESEP